MDIIEVDSKLRLVELDCPKSVMKDERARRLFEQTLLLKFEGYKSHYPADWLPADRSDYYATHMIVCLEFASGLVPVAATKNNFLSRNRFYHDAFGPSAMASASKDEMAIANIARIIREADEQGHDLIYSGSWSSDPAIRRDRSLARQTKELILGSIAYQSMELGQPRWIGAAALSTGVPGSEGIKERTFDFFVELGMQPITNAFAYGGLELRMLLAEKYTPLMHRILDRYRNVWKNRIVFSESPKRGSKVA
jgi:hypothetical protein